MRTLLGRFASCYGFYWRRIYRDRNGAIAILTALIIPPLLIVVGVAIEVSRWTVVKVELQRAADQAAMAGSNQYAALQNNKQMAANAAASVAELNGVSGAASRSWDKKTFTLTDNQVTVVVGPGLRDVKNIGISVTVARAVPLILTKVLTTDTTRTISASAWAELKLAQPCLFALGNGGITAGGSSSVELSTCGVRSNSAISIGGSATISAESLWAASTITSNGVTGIQHPNSGTVTDPYASDPRIVTAFSRLNANPGAPIADKPNQTTNSIPGTYSDWNIKGTVNLAAGIYYVNGDISLNAKATLTGSGVTIVMGGTLSMLGGSSMDLSAATTLNAQDGAIPGVVFAGNSTAKSGFGGNAAPALTGLIYYPNGTLEFHGASGVSSSGCLQVIANSIDLKGNSGMASNCDDYGTLVYGDGDPLGLVK